MALSKAQQRVASLIYNRGIKAGLPPARARELVAAAYAESTLNPRAHNPSGASGVFQLLSSGYVNKANQMGGVYDVDANTRAILPNYVSYWKSHPHAASGEAGRDVERSGEGAGFYSRPLGQLGTIGPPAQKPDKIGGGGGTTAADLPADRTTPGPQAASAPDFSRRNAMSAYLAKRGRGFDPWSRRAVQTLTEEATQESRLAKAAANFAQSTDKQGPTAVRTAQGLVAAAVSGGWADPVEGKVIGTPGAGTHTLGNWESDRALDIAVPVGTPVVAPFGGTVGSQFGSLGSSGRFQGLRLHVQSPQNEWYGAHLSRYAPGIKPGVRVKAGQVVGYSGSASGVAHLHEGLRSGDPYRLIRNRR